MKKTGFYAITAAAVLAAAGAAPLSSQAAQDPYLAAPGRVAAVFSVPAPAVGTLPGLSGLIRFPICTEKPSIPQAPEWPDTPLIPEQPDAPQSPELPDAPENNGSPETDGGVQEPEAETPAAQVLALVNAQRARAGLGSLSLDPEASKAAGVRAREIPEWTPRAQSGSLFGWFSLENLFFAKDFGLFCFVFAMTGVESRPTKDASTTPSSYSFRTRLAMIDFNAPLFNCRRQRSYVQ